MRFRALLAAALGLALPIAAQEAPRVDAEAAVLINEINRDAYPEMRIFATVTRPGAPVTGLGPDDFRVREEEIDQEPLTVETRLPPLSVVVTVDSSGSMSRRMDETRAAAKEFVAGLGDEDAAQLVSFARKIVASTPMTTSREGVLAAIDGLVARGDTALYDALMRSIELVAARPGRKAIVVLSDGVDDDGAGAPLSEASVPDVLSRAAEVNVPVFTLGLGTEMDESVLREIAGSTGALYLNAPEPAALSEVYGAIGDRLSSQYLIGYTSSLPADGTSRRVDLTALGATASKPYTAPGSAAAAGAAPPSQEGGCAVRDAFLAERPALEVAEERYRRDLITSVDRNAARGGHGAARGRLRRAGRRLRLPRRSD